MKLYKKQLNSLDELKRERHRLLYTKKQQDREPMFSMDADSKDKGAGGGDDDGIIGLLLSLAGSKSLADAALRAGTPLLKLAARKFPAKLLLRGLREVGGSYLKWKLVSGGIFLLRQFFEVRKENKRRAEESKAYNPAFRDQYARRAQKKARGDGKMRRNAVL